MGRSKQWTDENILAVIKAAGDITIREWIMSGYLPVPTTIIHYFGSWNAAKAAAGLSTKNHHWTREEIIEKFQALGEINSREWREKNHGPNITTIVHAFGSWSRARAIAGFTPGKVGRPVQFTKDDILREMQAIGHYITAKTWTEEKHSPSIWPIMRLFNTYSAAWEAADIPIAKYSDQHRQKIIATLRQCGPAMTSADWMHQGYMPSLSTVIHQFGSWNAAREAAGFPPMPRGRQKIIQQPAV